MVYLLSHEHSLMGGCSWWFLQNSQAHICGPGRQTSFVSLSSLVGWLVILVF